ncbi:MAG: exodeoxyribonuclease VII large subunit [Pseudomonadota bacterium]
MEQPSSSNVPIFSVSQISAEVKRTVEERFEFVRIRGEVSRPTRARSGHFYLTLKDERAVIDAVAWKGVAARIPFEVSEGMELIATGKLTTYPGQSKYQLVIDNLELAGEGALLKLLEERRKALMAEGLFDPARKRPLPLLPRSIGVVSSPNGAVIRDIWHRVRDRFPLPVLLWPTLVQGQGAADQVVRAAAACPIPLISAIGHETDTTLLDFVADLRAPTPTAAAEFAVPVRADLLATIREADQRLANATQGRLLAEQQGLRDVSRALANPISLLTRAMQDLDVAFERLNSGTRSYLSQASLKLDQVAARLGDPAQTLRAKARGLSDLDAPARLRAGLARQLEQGAQQVSLLWSKLAAVHEARERLRAQGWVTVQDADGRTLTSAQQVTEGAALALNFHDGLAPVTGGKGDPAKPKKPTPAKSSKPSKPTGDQGSLF